MDNDNRIVKIVKKIIKSIKFKVDYRELDIICSESGNDLIKQMILNAKPTMIARCGATEMRCIGEYISTGSFSDTIRREISELSGVFPTTDENLKRFCEFYMECVEKSDLLALWGVGAENKIVKERCSNETQFTELTALEPYYFENPWSVALKEKKVLVVHPFELSIKKQYENREKIFINQDILPKFKKFSVIKSVQTIAGSRDERFSNWFDALNYIQEQISCIDFDVAIIGAGAYSLPLAAYVKSIGKIAIQMSGSTQILFGIKGKRWEQIPEVSKFFNEYWIRPSDKETPDQSKNVEGGCYW